MTAPASDGTPRRRTRTFKVLALLIAGVISAALAEGFLRLAPGLLTLELRRVLKADPQEYGVGHDYIGHLHKPNAAIALSGRDFTAVHHTDGLGFRNTWPWPAQADVVVVGDSVTFGWGVADGEAWPAGLARSRPREAIINLGLIGAGPQQYQRVYETFGAKLRPKLLIIGFLASNDFWDAETFDHWVKAGTGGNYMIWRDFGRRERLQFSLRHPAETVRSMLSQFSPLLQQSYLYQALSSMVHEVDYRRPTIHRFADGTQIQLRPGDLAVRAAQAQPDRPEFRLALDALDQLRSMAAEQGAHVLVVLQPGKEETYLPASQVGDPEQPLRKALGDLGIESLDLTPEFRRRAEAGARLFFEVDGHPNNAGYALIAELVTAHLRKHAHRYGLSE